MTGAELYTMVDSILDDSPDEVLFYQLLNVFKNTVEDSRPWAFLKVLDDTQTATAGNNSTIARSLPATWRSTYKLFVGQDAPYDQVPFDEQHIWRNSSNRFFIDVANDTYSLLGTVGSAQTIYHYYIKTTPDITSITSPVWPSRFHPYLGFGVAGYIQMGVDADDIFARMSPENKAMALLVKQSMESWDSSLQMSAQGDRVRVEGMQGGIDLALM